MAPRRFYRWVDIPGEADPVPAAGRGSLPAPKEIMVEILALLPGDQGGRRRRLEAGVRRCGALLGAGIRVVFVPGVPELGSAARERDTALAVVAPLRTNGSPGIRASSSQEPAADLLLPGLARWLRGHGDTPVVAYLREDPPPLATLRLAELGVDEFLVRDRDDAPWQWDTLLLRLVSGTGGSEFLDAFPDDLPLRVRLFVRAALDRAVGDLPVHTLASEAVHREATTIYRELKRAGLPPPGRLARWARIYRVVRLVENTEMTWTRAASVLGYPSSSSFTNQVKRLTGHLPTVILDEGGTRVILELLLQDLRGRS